jgi:pimeloyl-ACP methyl ester carboxylesterase
VKNHPRTATGESRKIRYPGLVLFVAAFIALWVVVTGNHSYWRTFRGLPGDFGLKVEDASFLSEDGILLKGWYIRPQGVSLGTVIVVHGINGNRSDMLCVQLVRDNYNTLLVDLRDHGESGGNYAGPGYMESRDILGALKYLRNRGQTGPIAAMGHSYRAVAALYATAQSPDIAAVIADGALSRLRTW